MAACGARLGKLALPGAVKRSAVEYSDATIYKCCRIPYELNVLCDGPGVLCMASMHASGASVASPDT